MAINKLKKRIFQEISYRNNKYFVSPEIASLVITYKCNFKCEACTVWRMGNFSELSQNEWIKISENLKSSLCPEASIEISGGEPLLCKDLVYSLICNLKKFFKNVGINSNGILLDEETARTLKESGIDFAKISLYSLDNRIHDKLRGVSDAAERAKKAIELLREQDIKVDIGLLITSENILDIPNLIDFFDKPKYKKVSIVLQPLDEPIGLQPEMGENKASTIKNLWPDENSIKKLFSWLEKNKSQKIKNSRASLKAIEKYYLDQKSARNRRCFAGQRSLVIYPDGSVSLCYKSSIIGNMEKESLNGILLGSKATKERQIMKKCSKSCRIIGCNFSKKISEIVCFR